VDKPAVKRRDTPLEAADEAEGKGRQNAVYIVSILLLINTVNCHHLKLCAVP